MFSSQWLKHKISTQKCFHGGLSSFVGPQDHHSQHDQFEEVQGSNFDVIFGNSLGFLQFWL